MLTECLVTAIISVSLMQYLVLDLDILTFVNLFIDAFKFYLKIIRIVDIKSKF